MAGQITHIPYGKKVLDSFLKDKQINKKKFYIGTVFPDIRYLKVINRDKTHPNIPKIEWLRKIIDSFELGIYTHSLVDQERERVIEKLSFYKVLPNDSITTYAAKFLEDEITYPLFKDWPKVVSYLDDVLDEEVRLVPRESATKWHKMLRDYFEGPRDTASVVRLAKSLGFDNKLILAVISRVEELRENSKVMTIIQLTYKELFSA